MADPKEEVLALIQLDQDDERRAHDEERRQHQLLEKLRACDDLGDDSELEDSKGFELMAEETYRALVEGLPRQQVSSVHYAVPNGGIPGGGGSVFTPVPCTKIYPPASGDASVPGIDLQNGEVRRGIHMRGHGRAGQNFLFSWRKATPRFYFTYVPDETGEILVQPRVSFRGLVSVGAYDRATTSTEANLYVQLYMDVAQYRRWNGQTSTSVIHETHRSSHVAYNLDHTFSLGQAVVVNANDPVTIKVMITFNGMAQSKYAWIDCDFESGQNRIKVDHVRVCKW